MKLIDELNEVEERLRIAAALAVVAGIERQLFLKMAAMAFDWAKNFHDDMQKMDEAKQ